MERYGNLEFATKKELFKFIAENRDKLIAQKKAVKKEVDCAVCIPPTLVQEKTIKEGTISDPLNLNFVRVVAVINTTNFLDSHGDVHLPGIWNKSLNDNKMIMHLQEILLLRFQILLMFKPYSFFVTHKILVFWYLSLA
jgi:hypothetical protein